VSRSSSLQSRVQGARLYIVLAAALVVLGGFFLLAQLQSPDLVIWTGRCIPATERQGIAYYRVNGTAEALNDPNEPATAPVHTVTVCYQPAHPEQGMVVLPAARIFEGLEILGPLVLAALVLLYGLVIRPLRFRVMDEALPWPTR
jgi:hypothetical protein